MARFMLHIDTRSAGFRPVGSEIARILRGVAHDLDGVTALQGDEVGNLHDINGTFCGYYRIRGKHRGER